MGEGGTVNRQTGDYAYVTGNKDNVTFVSSEDAAHEVNQIQNEIDSSNLSPGEKEALKMNLEQNKYDELEKKKILDAARGSHIGY
jgi:glycogen synthase